MGKADANFDPYYKWLAISPRDRSAASGKPNHYRLLGVELFESDADVIASAADQRMAHLRSFQSGQYATESQKLLNEVAAARVCLLNASKKSAYDADLQTVQVSASLVDIMPLPGAIVEGIIDAPRAARRKPMKKPFPIGIVAAGAIVAGIGVVFVMMPGSPEEKSPIVAVSNAQGDSSARKPPVVEPEVKPEPVKPRPAAIIPEPARIIPDREPIITEPVESIAEPAESITESTEPEPSPIEPIQPKPLLPVRETETVAEPAAEKPAPEKPAASKEKFGKWIDAIQATNTARHSVAGRWVKVAGELVVEKAAPQSRIVIPFLPSGSYEATVEFTRTGGNVAGVILPIGGRNGMLSLESDGGGRDLFPAGPPVANGKRHVVEIRVTVDYENGTGIAAVQMDGEPFSTWEGPLDNVKLFNAWELPPPALMGLIADDNAKVAYHSVQVREMIGQKKPPRARRMR